MSGYDISMKGLSVVIGIPSTRDIHPLTVKSLLGTYTLCHKMNIPCQLAIVAGNAIIQWARDEVVDLFLETDANRLFWVDSDIVWEPEDFIRMLALSQENKVVCATYPAKKDETTFYVYRDEDKKLTPDKFGLVEIYGVGLGFTVMHREVIESLVESSEKISDEISGKSIATVFRVGARNGKRQGEDMAFFNDVREAGYKIMLDPSVNLGHVGTKIYTGSISGALKELE